MSNTILLVEAVITNPRTQTVEFAPYRITSDRHTPGYLYKEPLVRKCEDGPSQTFATALEAQQVLWRYEHGSSEDCRSATWDCITGEWIEEEHFYRPSRGDREDFHTDG